jgi:hypothetical protein
LNQKLGSKALRTVDFASRFILSIKSKFKISIFNNHYESQYKINDSQRFWTQFLIQRALNLPTSKKKKAFGRIYIFFSLRFFSQEPEKYFFCLACLSHQSQNCRIKKKKTISFYGYNHPLQMRHLFFLPKNFWVWARSEPNCISFIIWVSTQINPIQI